MYYDVFGFRLLTDATDSMLPLNKYPSDLLDDEVSQCTCTLLNAYIT